MKVNINIETVDEIVKDSIRENIGYLKRQIRDPMFFTKDEVKELKKELKALKIVLRYYGGDI